MEQIVKLTRRATVALLVAAPLALATGAGFAGAAPSTPQTAQLANSAAPGLEFATRTGSVAADSQMQVAVSLNYRDAAGLDALLARLNNPSSADYHHYLTPEQFTARFAPTQAQVDQVKAYLQGKGLTVVDVASNRMLIDAKGPAKTVQSAFATSVSNYHDNKTDKDFTANDTAPSVDASVAGLIGGISGLNNHYQLHSYTKAPQAGSPKVGGGPGGGYTAQELRSAYGVDKLVGAGTDGAGQSIAMLEFSHFTQANITKYDQQYATGSPTPTVVKVDSGDDDTAGGGVTEVELDIEVAHAIAPKANVAVYEAPNSDAGEGASTDSAVGGTAAAASDDAAANAEPTPVISTAAGALNLAGLTGKLPAAVISQIPDTAAEFGITTNLRLAHFLAQCALESTGFTATVENLNYRAARLMQIFPKYFRGVDPAAG